MGMMSEFKEFISKGNVMDLAVGVIIGGAFGKIVTSLVEDVIMPVVGKITGGVDFSSLYIQMGKATLAPGTSLADAKKAADSVVLAWGNFLTVVVNFLILAFIIFQMVKMVNRLKSNPPPAPPAPPPEDVVLLREIRDSLKHR